LTKVLLGFCYQSFYWGQKKGPPACRRSL